MNVKINHVLNYLPRVVYYRSCVRSIKMTATGIWLWRMEEGEYCSKFDTSELIEMTQPPTMFHIVTKNNDIHTLLYAGLTNCVRYSLPKTKYSCHFCCCHSTRYL